MPILTENERLKVKNLLASVKGSDFFCDPEFPATNESLEHESIESTPTIKWKRPHEIVSKPQMFVDGANRCDVLQGGLGDCWFLAAASAVATRPELINQVIPEGQVLYGEGYKGLVTFRFWRMGTWVTINIDDRLPVDEDDDLFYGKCRDPNEFWLPLLEKAFAKFHGNYNNLDGGYLPEGFQSLTGYITEEYSIEHWPRKVLFGLIRRELRNGSILTCARGELERVGLVTGHGYTITGAMRLRTKDEGLVRLLRVRNPWGEEEWVGAWDDNDSRWEKVEESIKKQMEYHPDNDGEFWIKVAHFIQLFETVCLTTKIPDYSKDMPVQFRTLFVMRNAWLKGKTAGGSKAEDVKKFATNPQYLLTVTEPDDREVCLPGEASDDEDVCSADKTCGVIIELVQEHNRKKFEEPYAIGISVFPYHKAKPHKKRLTAGDLQEFEELEDSAPHAFQGSVVARLNLEPGAYVVIPSTEYADYCRDFLLRVYCRKLISFKELCIS